MNDADLLQESNITNRTARSDELRFEYDQLRKEILHNDVLSTQVLAGVLTLGGVLMGFAFTKDVKNLDRVFLFVVVIFLATLGLWQKVDRERGTARIACYLRLFIENNVQGVNWETRLDLARKSQVPSKARYGEFYAFHAYLILISASFLLQVIYSILSWLDYNRSTWILAGFIILLSFEIAIVTNSLWRCWNHFRGAAERSDQTFENIWLSVKAQEEQGPEASDLTNQQAE